MLLACGRARLELRQFLVDELSEKVIVLLLYQQCHGTNTGASEAWSFNTVIIQNY